MLEPVTFEFGSETHIEPDFKERCGRETHRAEFTGRKSPVNPIVPSFSIFQADYAGDVVNRCSIRRPNQEQRDVGSKTVWVDSPQMVEESPKLLHRSTGKTIQSTGHSMDDLFTALTSVSVFSYPLGASVSPW